MTDFYTGLLFFIAGLLIAYAVDNKRVEKAKKLAQDIIETKENAAHEKRK